MNLIVAQPQFGDVRMTLSGLVMSGFNGPAGGNCYLLSATNIAQPLNTWTRVLTNQFDSSGNITFTNVIDPQSLQSYYLLQTQ